MKTIARFTDALPLSPIPFIRRVSAGGCLFVCVALLPAQSAAQILQVPYNPDQTVGIERPVIGLAAEGSDYVLAHPNISSKIPITFTSSSVEGEFFTNASTTIDAASSPFANTMFQLTGTGNLSLVNTNTGELQFINGELSVPLGAFARGIGTDPAHPHLVAFMRYTNGEMTFGTYDLNVDQITLGTPFTFDQSAFGTPTGFDFAVVGALPRALVGTRDGPGDALGSNNFILDMDFATGLVGQYATIMGSTDKLQDLLYMGDSRLATGYLSSTTGLVLVGDFTPIPEPALAGAIAGLAALVLAGALARRRRPPACPE